MQFDEFAVEIEVLSVRPHHLDSVNPLLTVLVAIFVIALLDSEHIKLVFVPTHDDVEAEPALPDVIGRHELLRRHNRMHERRMHGSKHRDAFRRRQQTGGPSHRLVSRALIIGVAAIALPATDRQQEVQSRLV